MTDEYHTAWTMYAAGDTRRVLLDRLTGKTLLLNIESAGDVWAFDERAELALRVMQNLTAVRAMRCW